VGKGEPNAKDTDWVCRGFGDRKKGEISQDAGKEGEKKRTLKDTWRKSTGLFEAERGWLSLHSDE